MEVVRLADAVEERYRRYLASTFYFKDPVLRASFEEALQSGHLSKGPYLEATPVFKRGQSPRELLPKLLDCRFDDRFLAAIQGDRPLYRHQEEAISRVEARRNVIVATGTGSGKTEAFLYPILLHLYREHQSGALRSGVRALVLYPMNALANDQRERLGGIVQRLKDAGSSFAFTFGQYIGETPEDARDARRQARDRMANRLPGEIVLRSEMRDAPPHILLTNYSMLEYLLLRPKDSQLFDGGQARWWTFLVLDEVHQYRGSRGTEMAMLLRRLKQRLLAGGAGGEFRCIATSATLAGGEDEKPAVARFAADLFGEPFEPSDVILGETEPVPAGGDFALTLADYKVLARAIGAQAKRAEIELARELASRLSVPPLSEASYLVGAVLRCDKRVARLRELLAPQPLEVARVADEMFDDLPTEQRQEALDALIELLLRSKNPDSEAPLLSARYHLFLRSLEGAFVSYWPEKKVYLEPQAGDQSSAAFEVAICRECGQL